MASFFLETFDGEAWTAEPANRFFLGAEPFIWEKMSRPEWTPLAGLFFGPQALLPFHRGAPPDLLPSRLCQAILDIGLRLHWLPFEELFIEDWATEQVLLSHWVPIPQAAPFQDGQGPFPEEALLRLGMTPEEVSAVRRGGWPAKQGVNRLWGKGLAATLRPVTEDRLEVTWVDSIEGHLGQSLADAFRPLPRRGRPARIIFTTDV